VPRRNSRGGLTQPDTGEQAVMLRTVSLSLVHTGDKMSPSDKIPIIASVDETLVVCLVYVYGILKIFRRHQVSKASMRLANVFVTVHVLRIIHYIS